MSVGEGGWWQLHTAGNDFSSIHLIHREAARAFLPPLLLAGLVSGCDNAILWQSSAQDEACPHLIAQCCRSRSHQRLPSSHEPPSQSSLWWVWLTPPEFLNHPQATLHCLSGERQIQNAYGSTHLAMGVRRLAPACLTAYPVISFCKRETQRLQWFQMVHFTIQEYVVGNITFSGLILVFKP